MNTQPLLDTDNLPSQPPLLRQRTSVSRRNAEAMSAEQANNPYMAAMKKHARDLITVYCLLTTYLLICMLFTSDTPPGCSFNSKWVVEFFLYWCMIPYIVGQLAALLIFNSSMLYLVPFLIGSIYMMVAETYLFYYILVYIWDGHCWNGINLNFVNTIVIFFIII